MQLKRNIYADLNNWKNSERRKPLVLDGARQVGKTTALNHLADTAYERKVYLNFEKDENLAAYFEKSISPKSLIPILNIHSGVDIEPENTLIIFDEVQECPRALNSLKYFCEDANEFHIAAAGSLLGVKTMHTQGFPVGKVNFLHMYPLTFFEYLSAINEEKLRKYLETYSDITPLPEPIHDKLLNYLKYYFFIGGMPEAVNTYLSDQKLKSVREVQLEILEAYQHDFSKHAPSNQVMKIATIWKQVHQQLAKENKKFIFSAIRKSARGRDYEEAIQWLMEAGLIYKNIHINAPRLPLSTYCNNEFFKIFMLDIGLLGAQSNLSEKTIIENNNLFTEFKGALTENYVAQELIAKQQNLYYWTSTGTAELDFILEWGKLVYPLEVKAGKTQKKKSLLSYESKYPGSVLSRSSLMNLKHDGKLYNFPLYLIARFPDLIKS